jgi:hypothetical protein
MLLFLHGDTLVQFLCPTRVSVILRELAPNHQMFYFNTMIMVKEEKENVFSFLAY